MSLSKVLAVVDGAPHGEPVLKTALKIGQQFSCRVEILHVEIDPEASIPVLGDGMSGAVVSQMIDSLRESAESRRETASRMFDEHCVRTGLPVVDKDQPLEAGTFSISFVHLVGVEADEVQRRGRLADLTILPRSGDDGDLDLSQSLDAALFDSGRPVLLVPASPPENLFGSVAVAWNGSREAARAVGIALPFLKKAEKAVVVTAREGAVPSEASELANYLTGHGIEAKTWAFQPNGDPVGSAILTETKKSGAAMLIMGAYGHSRLRELVLGGVTRSVLDHADIPVLLAH